MTREWDEVKYEVAVANRVLAEVGLAEVRRVEVRLAEVRLVEVGPPEVRLGQVRVAQIRPAEVRPAEVRLGQVHPEIRMCPFPCVPGCDLLPDGLQVLRIRHSDRDPGCCVPSRRCSL